MSCWHTGTRPPQGKESWTSVMTGSGGGEWLLAKPAAKAATVDRVRRVLIPADGHEGQRCTGAGGGEPAESARRREDAATSDDDDMRALVLCCLARASNVLAECTAECVLVRVGL